MWHLPHISLRLASAVAVLALIPSSRPSSILNSTMQAQNSKVDPPAAARLSSSYGKLPISFEVNQGQTDGSVQFLARGAGYTLFLTAGEAVLSLHAPSAKTDGPGSLASVSTLRSPSNQLAATTASSTVRLQLIDSNTKAEATGVDTLPGKSNYFVGNDPAKWHTNVPTYAKVRYSNVYPGIDLLYYGNHEGRLEHDFVVAPGADPNAIVMGVHGADQISLEQDGSLALHTKAGKLKLNRPAVYQTIDGRRRIISASYTTAGNNQLKFKLGKYDKQAPLVIDPVLVYTAVWGGSSGSLAWGMALDGSGNTYVTGYTWSTDFPVVHPVQGSWHGTNTTVFVSKINAAGTALLYSTFLGQKGGGSGIAVDAAGRAYVVGFTGPGLPVKNAYQTTGGDSTAFLTVLGSAGNTLVYSTYFGRTPGSANAVASDASGNAYITGAVTISPGGGIFVAKFNNVGVLRYSKYLVGGLYGEPTAIAVDASGSAYITGWTYDSKFPVTAIAFQSTCRACPSHSNAFVTKLSPAGDRLTYSTYLGGSQGNGGFGIAIDSSGEAYVAGYTGSGFPTTSGGFQRSFRGGTSDGFVSKLNSSGTALIWSTYLGGWGSDSISGIALDQNRTVYVAGETSSGNFPVKASLYPSVSGKYQKFVTTLSGSLSSITYYSTYLGTGSYSARHVGIAVDKALNVYLESSTDGDILPTPGALAHYPANVLVSKLAIMDDLALGLSGSSSSVMHGNNFTYTVAVTSKGPDFGYNLRIDDSLPVGTTLVGYNAGGGTCTAPPVGSTGTLHCTLSQLNKGQTYTVTLTVKVNAIAGTTLSNTATTVSNMQDFVQSNNKGTLTTKVN